MPHIMNRTYFTYLPLQYHIFHIIHMYHQKHIPHIYHILHIYGSFRGKNDCLVPLPPYLAGILQCLRLGRNKNMPPKVRAVDMRHVLLVLPFLLGALLDSAVLREHNRKDLLRPVHDPSTELVGINILFIQWCMLYRRRYPPNDKEDIKELATLGDR
jgi:hypothetical protein